VAYSPYRGYAPEDWLAVEPLCEDGAGGDEQVFGQVQAGHRPPFTGVLVEPMSLARLIVSRLDEAQQCEFIDLVQHPEKITDPGHGKDPHWEAYRARTTPPDVLAPARARAAQEKAAHRGAYMAAYDARRRAARAAGRALRRPPGYTVGPPP
jgi:hypothetical protein